MACSRIGCLTVKRSPPASKRALSAIRGRWNMNATRPSGLWEAVGPSRAKSRGLEPDQLPEYYRQRNLLKAAVTPEHVGNAVVFFASNLTPTTGATLPVDGGVAEAFPR